MAEDSGTHDLFKAPIGEEFGSTEVTVTEDEVERNAFSCDDYNPWYMKKSPFGGRIVSPTYLVLHNSPLFYSYYKHPAGTLHFQQDFEFINPLKLGKKVKISGKLINKEWKRGRPYFTYECMAVDEDGKDIVRMRRTVTTIKTYPESEAKW